MDLYAAALETVRSSFGDLFASLMEQDAALVGAGFPPMSPWWRAVLRAHLQSGKRRLVIRVGRRGGKSTMACRLAVNELLNGRYSIPPGDLGVYAIVSTKKGDARERLNTIEDILKALGVSYARQGDSIFVEGRPLAFRVYAANYRTAVGFTCIGLLCDEVARWLDDDTGANPATEVLRSMRPAMATQPNAREYLISSPWSSLDAHYEAFELGQTLEQNTAAATSWEANPTLTEARCRELEPDDATFRREYGAEPMSALASSIFDFHAIDEAVARCGYVLPRRPAPGDTITAGADFGFRRDSSACVVCHRNADLVQVADLLELSPGAAGPLRPSETVAAFAAQLKPHGAVAVMADAHYRESITEHLVSHGLSYTSAPTDVPKTYVKLRTLLHQGRLVLPDHPKLIRDMKEIQSAPTPSGRLRIILPKRTGGGHADLVSALVLAAWQKGGHVVQEPTTLPKGWTAAELEDVERMAARVRADRDDSWYSDEEGFIDYE